MPPPLAPIAHRRVTLPAIDFSCIPIICPDDLSTARSETHNVEGVLCYLATLLEFSVALQQRRLLMTGEKVLELAVVHERLTLVSEAEDRCVEAPMRRINLLFKRLDSAFKAEAMKTVGGEGDCGWVIEPDFDILVDFDLVGEADWAEVIQ